MLAAAPSLAQGATGDPAALRAEIDSVYQQLLVDPSDRALNRRMIDIAVQLNDYDAAIGAVERLIFYDPSNAALQLEAARFYMQIDSYAAAAGYLKDAQALPDLDAAQRSEVATLLAQAKRETEPSPWSGFGQIGARYQSNANHGSVALGLSEPLPFEKPEADWNSFALGTLGLAEPVTDNLSIEATVSGYYADQAKINRLDLGFAEATVGPRLTTEDGGLSIKPFAIVQGILLGDEPYQSAYGGGVVTRLTFEEGWWVEPTFEYKNRSYYNSDDYPDATDQTGDFFTYAVDFNAEVTDNIAVLSRLAFYNNQAAADYQSYDQYTVSLAMLIGFDLLGVEDWSLSPFARYSYTSFKGIAPTEAYAALDTKRRDNLWSVGANLEIPLRENIAFGVAVEYSKNVSNLDRDDYENLSVIFGPQGRF
ncbi:MAG: tetratricopeptide repeat protein [Bauldia litoralis]